MKARQTPQITTAQRPLARRLCYWLTLLSAMLLLAAGVHAAQPCCNIVAIDAKAAVVTAKDKASGKLFKFRVQDAALLRSLKVGQKVYANHATGKVSVDGAAPCCAITEPIAKDAAKPKYSEPCCNVAAIDVKTGVVQVRQRATGRVIKVQLSDRSFLEALKVGQAVDLVNLANNRVRLQVAGPAAIEGVRLD